MAKHSFFDNLFTSSLPLSCEGSKLFKGGKNTALYTREFELLAVPPCNYGDNFRRNFVHRVILGAFHVSDRRGSC